MVGSGGGIGSQVTEEGLEGSMGVRQQRWSEPENQNLEPGVLVHTCDPSQLPRGSGSRIIWSEFLASLGYISSYLKKKKVKALSVQRGSLHLM